MLFPGCTAALFSVKFLWPSSQQHTAIPLHLFWLPTYPVLCQPLTFIYSPFLFEFADLNHWETSSMYNLLEDWQAPRRLHSATAQERTVLWEANICNFMDWHCFRGTCYFHHPLGRRVSYVQILATPTFTLKMGPVSRSVMLVFTYHTAWCNIPEGCNT